MKNKRAQMNVGMIVIMIMAIFVGLALLQAIFNEQAVLTEKENAAEAGSLSTAVPAAAAINTSVNFTVAHAPTGWKADGGCPLGSFALTNNSGTAYTSATDYIVDVNSGIFHYLNTSQTVNDSQQGNVTAITYNWCPDGYNKDAGSRGIARQIGLFTALALAVFVIGYGVKEWLDNR